MNKPKRYLVTSALPYANGPLHAGHLTGAYIPADIYVRYLRMMNEDVLYICGSDEHGAAITIKAKKENISPQDIINKYHEINKRDFERIGISFDIYHRTSDPLHHQTASDFFKKLYEQGVFVERNSEQYFDEKHQQFLADRYITGTCPKCNYANAYGDQCESCGTSLSPTELIKPISTLSGESPTLKGTKHWYLPMNTYQKAVEEWIEKAQMTEDWKVHVLGQCRSWFKAGLQERAMTRDLDWGVKVPLSGADGKVLYVWLDAPIGYISATKALTDNWEKYWKDEETKLVHFIGKDNIVFHCIIFPMILQLHGDYVLPTNVPANQFMNLEGEKMSTSRNHVVNVSSFLADFANQEDVLRYALTVNMPENKDSDFSWQDLQARNNNELVAILGNFINRVLVLIHKYFDGTIPEISEEAQQTNLEKAKEVYTSLQFFPAKLDTYVHAYQFRNALNEVMSVARVGNKFLTETEPWKLIKQDKDQTAAVLLTCLDIIAYLGVYTSPFLPFSAQKIQGFIQLTPAEIEQVKQGNFRAEVGRYVNKPSLLFSKIDNKQIQVQLDKLAAAKKTRELANRKPEPIKPTISYDDFAKLDIRTGTITAAKKMKKTKKLLELTVTIGLEERTVVSGIAVHYKPADIIGKKVLLLANLAPRKLRGVESQGMILMAESGEQLCFVNPTEEVPDGSMIA